jgi:hypothetical protein
MNRRLESIVPLAFVSLAAFTHCANREEGPKVASSASQPAYATHFPAELTRVNAEAQTQLQAAATATDEMASFPDELRDPDWKLVEQLYAHADEEGKSAGFRASFEENAVIHRFFKEEKQPLSQRVAGGAQRAAKEKGCDADVYGPASWALEKGVEKQLEERARERSTVHTLIDEHSKALGEQNAEKLHAQADKISMTSYVVYLRYEFMRRDLVALSEQARDVENTLDERLERLKQQSEPDADAIKEVEAAQKELQSAIAETDKTLQATEQAAEKARQAYQRALNALVDRVQALAENPNPEG